METFAGSPFIAYLSDDLRTVDLAQGTGIQRPDLAGSPLSTEMIIPNCRLVAKTALRLSWKTPHLLDHATRVVDPFFTLVERPGNTTIHRVETTTWVCGLPPPEEGPAGLAKETTTFTLSQSFGELYTPEFGDGFDAQFFPPLGPFPPT